MKVIESSGATREEAIQRGLKELGVEMHAVDRIDVIDEGSKGFLGLGKRPVRVRLSVEHYREPREQGRREGGQDRRQGRPQQQNRPNRGEAPRSQERGAGREQQQGDNRRKGGPREGNAPHAKQGGDNRPGGRQEQNRDRNQDANRDRSRDRNRDGNRDRNREGNREGNRDGNREGNHDRNRDRNRPPREGGDRRGQEQKPRHPQAPRRPMPVTGKTASNVSEESMEAHRIAEQFENIDSTAVAEYVTESLPSDVREEEIFESITDEQGNEAAALLKEIISNMDLAGEVSFVRANDGSARLAVQTEEDSGILIGKRGVTLEAMQYLINRMLAQGEGNENAERVVVDVGDYVDRRHAMLRDMAIAMAKRAKESGRNVRLKPLSPQERRIIHLTLEKDQQVRTYSTGDSLFRSVIISPAGGERRGGNPQRNRPAPRQKDADTEMAPRQNETETGTAPAAE